MLKQQDMTEVAKAVFNEFSNEPVTEKPADMLRQIINASSKPGDVVADFFMGSGSTIKAAISLGRRAIGVELECERFEQTAEEIK